ncbi:MAG: GxxExxY protein [Caldilineaceae bacterium]
MSELRHGNLTYRLRGLIFQVRNELKIGWPEEAYHQALLQLLLAEGIPVLSKPRRDLVHRGVEVHVFEPDLIVADKVVLELKALPFQTQFLGEQYAQIIHYLKFFDKDLGLLVNFAPDKVQIKRVLWDISALDLREDYRQFKTGVPEQDRNQLHRLRRHVLEIGRAYGLGYPESVYRQIIALEIRHHHIPCANDLQVPIRWRDTTMNTCETPLLLVDNRYLLHIRSMLESPTQYDFTRMQTYLSSLKLQFGLVINFGRKQLQIYGVNSG